MGAFLALATALLWAVAVILFKKSVGLVRPFALSLFKNTVALACLVLTAAALGQFQTVVTAKDLTIMLVSGALGIGVSDTLLFMALDRLGASRTALIDCLYSPFVIVFSLLMLEETLPLIAVAGGALILGSVVMSSRGDFGERIPRRRFWMGCLCGVLAMATVAFAIVLVKPLLARYPLTWLSAARMAGGLAILVLLLPFHPDRKSVLAVFTPQTSWKWMFGGAFIGSFLSVVTWVAGFKYSQTGIAALLNQTSTVFIVVFAAFFLREPMTKHKLLAVAMAFAGAAILLY